MTATLTVPATLPVTACPHCGDPVIYADVDYRGVMAFDAQPRPGGGWVVSHETSRAYVRELLEKRRHLAWIDELLDEPRAEYACHFVTCRRDR